MAEIQELEFYILPDGKVEVQVSGVKGKRCLDVTEAFEKILGNDIEHGEFTRECSEVEEEQAVMDRAFDRIKNK